MTLNIDNACYGNLNIVEPKHGNNWYTITATTNDVPFKIDSEVLFSSDVMGKLYTGIVTDVDVQNAIIVLSNEIVIEVKRYNYFARLY